MGLPRIGITSAPLVGEPSLSDGVRREHVDGVVAAGGLPVILPVLAVDLVDATLESVDGVLVAGPAIHRSPLDDGARRDEVQAADRARAAFELPLVRAAVAAGLPVLGLGRGHQVVNVALGGTSGGARSSASDADGSDGGHPVRIAPGSLLAAVMGTTSIRVASLHHRGVAQAGAGLQVVARSEDGHVEAVEGLGDLRVLGVQWHPDPRLDEPAHAALFTWLVREASVHPGAEVVDLVRADEVGPVPPSRAASVSYG